jgi:peptidoglycan/LPS O-acetylase OafA/YrhL
MAPMHSWWLSPNREAATAHKDSEGTAVLLGHRASLDGLRGVAVLAVMLFHSGVIRGGFLGVDIFFVLSGFLITSLLLEEHAATGRIGIRRFYLRRALRLLPALVAFLIVWGVVLLATVPPHFWPHVGRYIIAVLFYVANWARISGMPLGIFGHAWSLAVEEQFYLMWPIMLTVLIRRVQGVIRAAGILVAAAAVSLAWRFSLALGGASEYRIYCGTDTHADGLLVGAAVAFLLASGRFARVARAGKIRLVAATVSLAGLIGLLLAAQEVPGYVYGVSALVACTTAVIIVDVMMPGSYVARPLETWGLAGVGRISYGLYLWHYPVFFYFGALTFFGGTPWHLQSGLAWGVTFMAALASYFIIERRFLAYKDRFTSSRRIGDSRFRMGTSRIQPLATGGDRESESTSVGSSIMELPTS